MSDALFSPHAAQPAPSRESKIAAVATVACGVIVSLCVTGYTFLQSNQHVYLLDALYSQHPENLARDWFTTHTLQYHVVYTHLTVLLEQLHVLAGGFITLYVVAAIALHVAWRSIARSLGGDDRTYLLSVVLYHLSAGGLGLGVYQFLQDGSFLPSNVSSVASLAALAFWVRDRRYGAAICVGIAGLFHVNYALLLGFAWTVFTIVAIVRRTPQTQSPLSYVWQSLIALVPCCINLFEPVRSALTQPDHLPMDVFVPLYIKLRHPHHFDAAHWPLALWLSFLWPLPLAFVAIRRLPMTPAVIRARDVFVLVLVLQAIATVFAGIWFVNQTLVLVSLFRISIFAKLLSCVLTAWLIARAARSIRTPIAGFLIVIGVALLAMIALRDWFPATIPTPSVGMLLCAGVASAFVGVDLVRGVPTAAFALIAVVALPPTLWLASQQRLGPAMPGEGDAGMADVSDWTREHTPVGALFLVPPHDSMFRLRAERSAVIGFKHVPQLSAELIEWKRRLDEVLGVDILTLRGNTMQATADAMERTYAALPASHLEQVARHYGCDDILAMANLGPAWESRLQHVSADRRYWLYRVDGGHLDNAAPSSTLPTTQPER